MEERELKFRIWSYVDKAFHYFTLHEGIPDGIAMGTSYPQQFTGQQDKTKKDIYEGDFIKMSDGNVREVIFRGSGFYCTCSEYSLDTCWFHGGGPRIVGNNFETPNLERLR